MAERRYPEFEGRAVVVAGAANGMGAATARAFAANAARVVCLDRDGAALDRLTGELGDAVLGIAVDMTDEVGVHAAAERAVGAFGPLAAWANFVGYYSEARAVDMAFDEFTKGLVLNLGTAFLGAQAAARQMLKTGGGAIINTSSNAGTKTSPRNPHYSSAKAGVLHLTHVLAAEWGSKGIRVNTIIPGYVKTAMLDSLTTDPERRALLAKATPLKRLGEPEDIADVALFLCSDAARYMTGATVNVDGGLMIG
jgi:NAD(P)-dependent dehydrogenase (short-subunit alcohol dehydrogenase family)